MTKEKQSRALVSILERGEAEIKRRELRDVDEFLGELQQENEGGARESDRTDC